MIYLFLLISVVLGGIAGYIIGYRFAITYWEDKFWSDIHVNLKYSREPVPSETKSDLNFLTKCIFLIALVPIYLILEILIFTAVNKMPEYKHINILMYATCIISALIFSALFWLMASQRDKKKFFSTGEILLKSNSPNEMYKITAWRVWDKYVRCEILNQYNSTRTIYFNACDSINIEWLDNDTVVINGEELNAETGVYDARIHPLRSGL